MHRLESSIERIPKRMVGPLWSAAAVLAIGATALLLHAVAYGRFATATIGLLLFVGASGAWQIADRLHHG